MIYCGQGFRYVALQQQCYSFEQDTPFHTHPHPSRVEGGGRWVWKGAIYYGLSTLLAYDYKIWNS